LPAGPAAYIVLQRGSDISLSHNIIAEAVGSRAKRYALPVLTGNFDLHHVSYFLKKYSACKGKKIVTPHIAFKPTLKGAIMSKILLALLLALSVPTIYAQGAGKQGEYQNPPSTRGSGTSRGDVKAEERSAGSLGTKQGEFADPAKRRKGEAAAPTNDPFANSRNEKAQARSTYKGEKAKDRAEYRKEKKESANKLKATHQRSDTEKNLEVPK
jgi:hypothetical protein